MRKLLIICVAAIAVCGVAKAETVDLAGADANATLLTADTVYVNSSETTASLVFDNADAVTFAGTIQGSIAVVKQGAGELTLTGANTYSGGTYVSNGWLKVNADSRVGGGAVRLGGGSLRLGGNWEPSATCITLDADASIDTGSYDLKVKQGTFVTAGHTMTKIGSGRLVLNSTGFETNTAGATWIIDEGCIFSASISDPFGGAYGTNMADLTLELHENTYLVAQGHLPFPARVVLRGAELRGARDEVVTVETSEKWRSFSINGTLTVVPSASGKASVINANAMHMGHQGNVPTIVVEDGAELVLNVSPVRGYMSDATPTSGAFVKRGAGKLTLAQHGTLAGVVRIEEGTLCFGKDGSLGKDASLTVMPSAKVELDDGAVLDCRYGGDNLLSTADIWIDATAQVAGENAALYSVVNRGRCGGAFVQGTGRSGNPARPTYSSTALNGRPAFCFDGTQALVLNTYTNRSKAITVFAVARCTRWENAGNKGKWAAYLAMHSAATNQTDNNVYTSLYHQDNGGYDWMFGSNASLVLDHNATINYLPVIDCVRRNGNSANAIQYVYNNGEVTSKTDTASPTFSFNIDMTALGCRIGDGGKLEYSGTSSSSTRCFYGQIGEILVFSRSVTDDERAAVNEYLSRKWFGVTNTAVTASIYNGSVQSAAVSVPRGTATLATPQTAPGVLEKEGAGTLQLNVVSDQHEVRVKEGTLALMPTSVVAHIDVWMDAADASTVTTNANGRITAVRNKGNAGGAFGASPSPESASYGAPTPVWERSGINALPSLKFAGDSALTLDSYINTNAYGFLNIFMVAERSPEFDGVTAGKGKWSALISMESKDINNSDNAQEGAFVYEESPNGSVSARMHRGPQETDIGDITNKVPNAAAFVFSAYLCGYRQYYAFESLANAAGAVTYVKKDLNYNHLWATDINRVQLGCRLNSYGKAPLYGDGDYRSRAWYGRIGEVIICTATLSDEEKAAILGYLRKKWMNKGEASATAPAVLTGTALAGTLGADTALALSGGSTVASAAATQPIASLTASGAATLARRGVTDPAGYSMFSVGGDVTLPAAMTFRADDLPSDTANILTYGGLLNAVGTQWSVVSEKAGPHIANENGAVRLIPYRGLRLLIR